MKHRRFRVDPEKIQGRQATIDDPEEIRHIRTVLRLGEGESVILFDGRGKEYQASIARISPLEISFSVAPGAVSSPKESPLKIVLGAALLKSARFDWLLQKATELGVGEIIPFSSSHVVPRWGEGQGENRHARWEKIVAEAAKQSGRAVIPGVLPLRSFEGVLDGDWGEVAKIILWEKEKAGIFNEAVARGSGVFVLVGPEGGFSDEEAGQAQAAGFQPVGLGPRILRAETAGIAAVAILQYILGDINR
jgi:16S rRNA (uracil1498-N3)-methyltransferase